MKIIAIFSVILQHISIHYVSTKLPTQPIWQVANIYLSFSIFCVPVFVMLSGMFLLSEKRNESLQIYFRKRIKKVFIPFIVWGIIYALWYIYGQKLPFSLHDFVRAVVGSGGKYYAPHMWFLPLIIGLYIAAPVLKIFVNNASKKLILYFLLIWFVFCSIFPIFQKFFGLYLSFYPSIYTKFTGFFILGYFLSKFHGTKKNISLLIIIFLFGWIVTVFGTYSLSIKIKSYDDFFYFSCTPNIIFMSLTIFLIILTSDLEFLKSDYLRLVGSSVFGIYLVHIIILYTSFRGVNIFTLISKLGPVIGIPIATIIIGVLCFITVIVMKRMPVIKHIVP